MMVCTFADADSFDGEAMKFA